MMRLARPELTHICCVRDVLQEPAVLRCFPFDALGVRAVLIETDKVSDLKEVDRFFHRHGFVNYETFQSARNTGRRIAQGAATAKFSDRLYVRRQREAVYPPWQYPAGALPTVPGAELLKSASHCPHRLAKDLGVQAKWCSPWQAWTPVAKEWAACEAAGSGAQAAKTQSRESVLPISPAASSERMLLANDSKSINTVHRKRRKIHTLWRRG